MIASTVLPVITDDSFPREVGPGTGYVAVEFSAGWCAPCRIFAPVVADAASEYAGRIRVLQMDADASAATMARLGVRSLPTFLVFRDGVEVDRIVGAVPRARLFERLDAILATGAGEERPTD